MPIGELAARFRKLLDMNGVLQLCNTGEAYDCLF